MGFVTDTFAAWLLGRIADAASSRLISFVLGDEQERALRRAATDAVQRTAAELRTDTGEREQLAAAIDQVFREPVAPGTPAESGTLLEAIQDGIVAQLAPLDDTSLTEAGMSAAEILDVSVVHLAEKLTEHLLRQIIARGMRGGPLEPLANQLNHEVTHLQGQEVKQMLVTLTSRVLDALPELKRGTLEISAGQAAARTLPADVPFFTGRQVQLVHIMNAWSDQPNASVVHIDAIDGMAGVGKTALAVHIAHQLAPRFPDGQIFVHLHGHTVGRGPVEAADALTTLLLSLGVPPQRIPAELDARANLWRTQMADRRALLLLDDAVSSEQVRPLLPGTAGALVLITSRRRLAGLHEAVSVSLDVLEVDEAANLFTQLSGRPSLDPADTAVTDIVALCGNLPLAISMVAGQFKNHPSWTAADLATDLEAATVRLSAMTAENESVAASFNLSYRDLTENEQQLFRLLGLHPGIDFDAYAAAALANIELPSAREQLDSLFGRHLIDEPAKGRYRLHDLIREHARNLAAADIPAEREAAVGRLLDYYMQCAATSGRYLWRQTPAIALVPEQRPTWVPDISGWQHAVTWLESERPNLHAAVDYAAAHGWFRYAVAIPAALHGFLIARGYWDQASTLHHTALAAARQAGDLTGEATALTNLGSVQRQKGDIEANLRSQREALAVFKRSSSRLGQAHTHYQIGFAQLVVGDLLAATASLQRARRTYHELGDQLGEANSLEELGTLRGITGGYDAAVATKSRAYRLYRSLDRPDGEARALIGVGTGQYLQCRYADAVDSLTRALELARRIDDRRDEANAQGPLGVAQLLIGDYESATANLGRALSLNRDLGNRFGEANCIQYLGIAYRLMANYRVAKARQNQALTLYLELGHPAGQANALTELAVAQYLTGDYKAATAGLEEASILFRDHDKLGLANALAHNGVVQYLMGNQAVARDRLGEALGQYRELNHKYGEAFALSHRGVVFMLAGDYRESASDLEEALGMYRQIGSRHGEAEAGNSLGDLLRISSATDDALAHHERSLHISQDIGAPLEEGRALEGIGRCHLEDNNLDDAVPFLRQALAIYKRIGSPRASRAEATLLERRL
jgi:tetratricopeptide (TPR) repeat protein